MEERELAPTPFSWRGVAYSACVALCGTFGCVADFFDEVAEQFAHAHNKFLDDADREKFSRDVLSGLDSL